MLSVALLLAVAGPTDTWGMGGGRAWINPPKLSGDRDKSWDYDTTKQSQASNRAEFERFQAKARKGDVKSMRVVGYVQLSGLIDYSDPTAAMGWFYEAAVRGDPLSMYMLACGFEYGVGLTLDANLAKYWHNRAEVFGAPKTCR